MASSSFYKLPAFLFTAEFMAEHKLSIEAKVLYAFMLDRANMSAKNHWVDENGVFINFTRAEVMAMLEVSHFKAKQIFRELQDAGLINREISGNGAPSIIYVNPPEKWIESGSKKGRKSSRRGAENMPGRGQEIFPEGAENMPSTLYKRSREEDQSEKDQGRESTPPPTLIPEEEPIRMSPDVLRIYDEWKNYREKRGALPAASWKKTAEQLNEYSEKYGVEAVRKLVDQMIAEGRPTIYFDRLDRSPPRQTGRHGSGSSNRFHDFSGNVEGGESPDDDSDNMFHRF